MMMTNRPRKSKLLSKYKTVDNVDRITMALRRFVLDQPVEGSLPEEQCVTTLNLDLHCDFSPEAYLSVSHKKIDAAFRAIETQAATQRASLNRSPVSRVLNIDIRPVHDFIQKEERAQVHTLKEYPTGNIPVVASTCLNNGVAGWLDVPGHKCLENCITISTRHNTQPCEAFWHPYRFAAVSGHALVIRPVEELMAHPFAVFYLCESITAYNAWRYHYARTPKLHKLEVGVPVLNNGKPDFETMSNIVLEQIG